MVTWEIYIQIANNVILSAIKRKVVDLNLPVLNRKWKGIDTEYIGKYEIALTRVRETKRLLNDGCSNVEIARHLGITPSGVYLIIKRNNLK